MLHRRQIHLPKLLIRLALMATCPLLAVSMLVFLGLSFGGAFVAEFTVENRTGQRIAVTPIGTVGKKGDRQPLPVYMWPFPPIWSSQRGGFEILPGESIDIMYDWDDINFSEIVVRDHAGERGQLVVDANPTRNQYRAPSQTRFAIDDIDSLEPVTGPVRNAARNAHVPTNAPWIILGMLLGPWIVFIVLRSVDRRWSECRSEAR
jgi:hypothetical protein